MSARNWISLAVGFVLVLVGFVAGDRYRNGLNLQAEPTIPKRDDENSSEMVSVGRPRENQSRSAVSQVVTSVQRSTNSSTARLSSIQERFLIQSAEERSLEYVPLLTSLGLTPEQIENVSKKLVDLHRQAMTAGDAMLPLLQARVKYDKEMKALLGDDSYQKYRAFESEKPYRREIDYLIREAATREVTIDPFYRAELISLFQEFGIQTMESWDGPYDSRPSPLARPEVIEAKHRNTLATIGEGFADLQKSEKWRSLPQEVTGVTIEYLDKRVEDLENNIRFLKLSDEERRHVRDELSRRDRERTRP